MMTQGSEMFFTQHSSALCVAWVSPEHSTRDDTFFAADMSIVAVNKMLLASSLARWRHAEYTHA
jgi:N-dimethylarginine dimethylaminohydrolase